MTETLLLNAAKRSLQYLERIGTRKVQPDTSTIKQLKQLDEPFPARGMNPGDVLHLLDERCSPATMGVAGPRFFGFVIGGSLPVTLAANWLAGGVGQKNAPYQKDPGPAPGGQNGFPW